MKKCVIAATTLLIGGSAWAADMPVKAPIYKAAPEVVVYSWTGCYIGAGVTYGMYVQKTQEIAATGIPGNRNIDQGGKGWAGTVQGGCDYQVGSSWVIGAFADLDFSDIHGDFTGAGAFFGLFSGEMKLSRSWAAGGRIGYLINPSLLSFVSGGYTRAKFDPVDNQFNAIGLPVNIATAGATYNGWFLGGGVEYAIGIFPGLFWKTEYRYAHYDSRDLVETSTVTGLATGVVSRVKPDVQTVRTELVWRFNLGEARAKEMAKNTPSAPPWVYSWTGCYGGAGVTYGMYVQKTQEIVTATGIPINRNIDQGGKGWAGTVQGGCDYQVGSSWVIGAFADLDFSDIHGDFTGAGPFVGPVSGEMKLSRSWAAGGRIGYLVNPSFLSFVSGGYTEAKFDPVGNQFGPTGIPINRATAGATHNGWFLGSGVEYAIGMFPGLFWKTEYRYARYDSRDLVETSTVTGLPTGNVSRVKPDLQTVRTELVWRFNFDNLKN